MLFFRMYTRGCPSCPRVWAEVGNSATPQHTSNAFLPACCMTAVQFLRGSVSTHGEREEVALKNVNTLRARNFAPDGSQNIVRCVVVRVLRACVCVTWLCLCVCFLPRFFSPLSLSRSVSPCLCLSKSFFSRVARSRQWVDRCVHISNRSCCDRSCCRLQCCVHGKTRDPLSVPGLQGVGSMFHP